MHVPVHVGVHEHFLKDIYVKIKAFKKFFDCLKINSDKNIVTKSVMLSVFDVPDWS